MVCRTVQLLIHSGFVFVELFNDHHFYAVHKRELDLQCLNLIDVVMINLIIDVNEAGALLTKKMGRIKHRILFFQHFHYHLRKFLAAPQAREILKQNYPSTSPRQVAESHSK